uniref:Uncharacterized protein n=1 Tax=Romanomermis culicivorax TaxID=13658 RepID=A0A915IR94_ROMCU
MTAAVARIRFKTSNSCKFSSPGRADLRSRKFLAQLRAKWRQVLRYAIKLSTKATFSPDKHSESKRTGSFNVLACSAKIAHCNMASKNVTQFPVHLICVRIPDRSALIMLLNLGPYS